MKTIRQIYSINAPVAKVWVALTNPKDIAGWGGGPAKMSAKEGAAFSLWGGDIHGKNVLVVSQKKLVQEWYGGKWPKPSITTFTLAKTKSGTRLAFHQTGVPAQELKSIEDGWKDYYLGPLKAYCEGA